MFSAEATLLEAIRAFDFGAPVVGSMRYGNGHINDTFCVHTQPQDNCCSCFILQRINSAVFPEPEKVMHNAVGVTKFLADRIRQAGGDPIRETLTFLKARNGMHFYTDSMGGIWRATPYIENTCCYQQADTPQLFEASARAFGKFQRMLDGYPAADLFETIPKFHDTEDRLNKLKAAIATDTAGRVKTCDAEIDFILARQADCSVVLQAQRDGLLPLRVTHNDTKLNNILMDKSTGEGVCIIDLDTTMPGLSINDFGDSIRFGANHCAEDEKDLSKVNFDLTLFEAYTRGFLAGCGGVLTSHEIQYLPWGARLMTLECGIRFLTDYLEGDHYFRIHYSDQNLDRCRTQFKLVADMEAQFDAMQAIVNQHAISG